MPLIMLVDDSSSARVRVRQAFAAAGYSVVEAVDGVDALEKLHREPIELVVCDVNMPRMNGVELLEAAAAAGIEAPPFLMLTSEGRIDLMQRAKERGAKAWIFKPFQPEHVVASVRRILEGK